MEIRKIKKALNKHGIIAFPTETVMGLGVFYDDFEAYEKLNKVKQRREDKPYTMMLGDPKKITKYADVDHNARKLISAFMPGSVTLLLHAKENVPSYVTHGTGVVGVRVPSLVDILDMLNQLGKPLLLLQEIQHDHYQLRFSYYSPPKTLLIISLVTGPSLIILTSGVVKSIIVEATPPTHSPSTT